MKKLLFLLILLFPISIFAAPVDSIWLHTESFSCPYGSVYGICGGINAKLHNQFISAIKKKDAISAIKYWNKMAQTTDGSDDVTPLNLLLEPLFGGYEPEWMVILPKRILAKKAYKWGIITLGTNNTQDWVLNEYYISFIRYKNDGMVYVYNESLIPLGSKQYNAYSKLYSTVFNTFDKDIASSFNKWKFNNKDANTVYQKFIKSIK